MGHEAWARQKRALLVGSLFAAIFLPEHFLSTFLDLARVAVVVVVVGLPSFKITYHRRIKHFQELLSGYADSDREDSSHLYIFFQRNSNLFQASTNSFQMLQLFLEHWQLFSEATFDCFRSIRCILRYVST